jgi:two-component system response regulator RegA
MGEALQEQSPETRLRILLVDDSENLCFALRRAFERRGYEVECSHCADTAMAKFREFRPTNVVMDLKMPGASGLTLIKRFREHDPTVAIVVVTGYSSVATAIEAIKLGAVHYLAKPVDATQIEAAFQRLDGDDGVQAREAPLSVDRLEWEHIQTILSERQGNVSATARALGMHRRTLQRKLSKRPVAL